ncbi:MAG: AraC family transcriptional regulator, partial [Lachnospiraceae bacterium]|nr:AraC family transcriptional regulator [Lachnospiraceae bacterium]
ILPGGSGLFLMAARLKNGADSGSVGVRKYDGGDGEMSLETLDTVRAFTDKANLALKTYFELTAVFGVSRVCDSYENLEECFGQAKTALDDYYYDSSAPVVFYTGQKLPVSRSHSFNINFIKKDLAACVHQNDGEKLREIFGQLIGLFREHQPSKSVAVSACINLYTYLYSFFEEESAACQDIFPYSINVAKHLNRFCSLTEILNWMQNFGDKLSKLLNDRKKNPADRLSARTRRYIDEHCQEKLTLTKIAQDLNISAGHLSLTFSKSTGMTVSDYIAYAKTERAKELLRSHQYLIYEISDMLGFENPYYFSKVFKKATGLSPREYEKSV